MSDFYEDKNLSCKDCKQPFVYTGGEQRFFVEKGFVEPTRCKSCRSARKAQKADQPGNPGPSTFAPRAQTEPLRPVVYDVPPQEDRMPSKKKAYGGGKRNREDIQSRDWDD